MKAVPKPPEKVKMLWIQDPETRHHRSEPDEGYPDGEFVIRRLGPSGLFALFHADDDNPNRAIYVGSLEKCKKTAQTIVEESEIPIDVAGPRVMSLHPLTDRAEEIILLTRRTFLAGERLLKLLDMRAVPEMVNHNLDILEKLAEELTNKLRSSDAKNVGVVG